MKIKLYELDNKVVDIREVNIVGDSLAYDIFYKHGDEWYHSLCVEELEREEKIKQVEDSIEQWREANIFFKFDITLDLSVDLDEFNRCCKACTHYQDVEEGIMGQSGDLNEPHCYTGKCHLHQKKVDLFDGCGQFKSMKEDDNHSANKDEPLTPQSYQRFDIDDKFYDAVIIATDYTFSVGEFIDCGEHLFIDLTLKNGTSGNRYFSYCGYGYDFQVIPAIEVRQQITSISKSFFMERPEVVDRGVIPNSLKHLLKEGIL